MKAVRVAKRGRPYGLHMTHWIRETDETRTVCGKVIADLADPEHMDVAEIPAGEQCLACDRARHHYGKTPGKGGARVTLQPSLGYFSPQHGRGRRILK